jgi:hypothetical protein
VAPEVKLESIKEEVVDMRTAQQTTFTSRLNREHIGGGPVYHTSVASKIVIPDNSVKAYRKKFKN